MVSTNGIRSNTAFGPCLYKLPAVKECLYHPNLPTFRRMDIDTAAHKLPDEHCRTTADCSTENFRTATITLYRPAKKPLTCTNVTETGRSITDGTTESNMHVMRGDGPLFQTNTKPQEQNKAANVPFSGYSMRYLSPSVTTSWKYALRQEPFVDHHGQRPVPANIFSRHRNLSSTCRVSTYAWRP